MGLQTRTSLGQQRLPTPSNVERLNPANALLLAVHTDAAFNRHLISFDEDGRLLIQLYHFENT
ncbi:hypothetical protein LMG23994_05246 [Cupriavidus pinatubonensis]|uniref:Phytase n=1 Tax=Cupriavidus pinatubonensis TaxID=248026 RepID=A0ABM8XU58_9BURK|nr:hypothetical protein LMG23994_05246 [Cupriavidus pinatubonensis]